MASFDLDLRYTGICAVLVILTSLYFLYKHPAANVGVSLALIFCGRASLGPISASRILWCLLIVAILYEMIRRREPQPAGTVALSRSTGLFVAGVISIIFVKIALDCMIEGLDEDRTLILKNFAVRIFIPSVLFFLCLRRSSPERVFRDLLLGLTAYSVIVAVSFLPAFASLSRLSEAASGGARLSLLDIDTINSAQLFYCGSIASLGLYFTSSRVGAKIFSVCASFLLVILVFLNGTRQYLLGYVVVVALFALTFRTRTVERVLLIAMIAVAVLGSFAASLISGEAESVRRLQAMGSSRDAAVMTGGRLPIWTDAIKAGLDKPLWGQGFRKFGDLVFTEDPLSHEITASRGTAHGIMFDVIAEHGILLGFLLGAALLTLLWRIIKELQHTTSVDVAGGLGVLVGMVLPLNFSGTILEGLPLFMLTIYALYVGTSSGRATR